MKSNINAKANANTNVSTNTNTAAEHKTKVITDLLSLFCGDEFETMIADIAQHQGFETIGVTLLYKDLLKYIFTLNEVGREIAERHSKENGFQTLKRNDYFYDERSKSAEESIKYFNENGINLCEANESEAA